jgi:hypothetical protein
MLFVREISLAGGVSFAFLAYVINILTIMLKSAVDNLYSGGKRLIVLIYGCSVKNFYKIASPDRRFIKEVTII